MADIRLVIGAGIAVVTGDIGEEHGVELRRLERPREVDPDVHVLGVGLTGVGATPVRPC